MKENYLFLSREEDRNVKTGKAQGKDDAYNIRCSHWVPNPPGVSSTSGLVVSVFTNSTLLGFRYYTKKHGF